MVAAESAVQSSVHSLGVGEHGNPGRVSKPHGAGKAKATQVSESHASQGTDTSHLAINAGVKWVLKGTEQIFRQISGEKLNLQPIALNDEVVQIGNRAFHYLIVNAGNFGSDEVRQ